MPVLRNADRPYCIFFKKISSPVPVGSAALDIKVTFVGEYLFLASLFSPHRLKNDDIITS